MRLMPCAKVALRRLLRPNERRVQRCVMNLSLICLAQQMTHLFGTLPHLIAPPPSEPEETSMTECQHRWQPVEGQPIYKCARCGAFLRIIK